MWLESPLQQGIRDALRLLRKGADEVNVFDLAIRVDDDPDGLS